MRWGVLGTGKIAHDFVTALFASSSETVVAVASRSLERSNAFAVNHNIPAAFGSYEALLDEAEIDIVYVATSFNGDFTSTADHVATARKCVLRKKAVLMEKPMASTAADARSLAESAALSSVFLMEGVWMHFFPVIEQIRLAVSSGELGEVTSVQASFGWRNSAEHNPAVEDASLGGGALGAVGIYLIHLALLAYGGRKPTKVEAIAERGALGADVHTSILLGWPGNAHAVLTCSLRENLEGAAVIHGSKGTVRIPFPFLCPVVASVCVDGAPPRELRHELPQSPEVRNAAGKVISGQFNLVHSAGLAYEAEAVARAVATGALQSEAVPLERSLLALEIMDEVRAKSGLSSVVA